VVGTYDGPAMIERLKRAMEDGGYEFVLPEVAESER